MSDYVLDASAVIALLNAEPGAETVNKALPRAVIGAVNLSEVLAKSVEAGHSLDSAVAAISPLGLPVIDFDPDHARLAAGLRAVTRPAGLSLGDRACIALGRTLEAIVLTADRSWAGLDVGVTIEVIR